MAAPDWRNGDRGFRSGGDRVRAEQQVFVRLPESMSDEQAIKQLFGRKQSFFFKSIFTISK